MALGYLISPVIQVEDVNGKPLVGGRIRVYEAGTTNPYITYKDWNGNRNPAEVILDAKGMCILIADDNLTYDIYCEDRERVEQWSRLNVVPGQGNGGTITNIVSGDNSITIIKNGGEYDLRVNDGEPSAIVAASAAASGDMQFQFTQGVINSHGSDLFLHGGKVCGYAGWYHYDMTVRIDWIGYSNRTVNLQVSCADGVSEHEFDTSFPHSDWVVVSGDYEISTNGQAINAAISGLVEGMGAQVTNLSVHKLVGSYSSGGGGQGGSYEAGNGITIVNNNIIEIDPEVVQEKLTEGFGIDIVNNEISVDTDEIQEKLEAGSGITIEGNVISASTVSEAGDGINISGDTISVDFSKVQRKLIPGNNIQISSGPSGDTISATDTRYSAGDNIIINEDGVISATAAPQVQTDWDCDDPDDPAFLLHKPYIPNYPSMKELVAGSNVSIVETLDTVVISSTASGGTTYTFSGGLTENSGTVTVDHPVPAPAAADNGKVLGVVDAIGTLGWVNQSGGGGGGTTYTFTGGLTESSGTVTVDHPVPAPASADNGKVLGVVDAQGTLGWVNQTSSGIPSTAGMAGKVLKVNAGGTGVEWGDDNNTTYNFTTGLTENAGNVYVTRPVPAASSSDNGKVLGIINSNGDMGWVNQSGGGGGGSSYTFTGGLTENSGTVTVDHPVPAPAAADEDKVLGVVDAQGTLGWVAKGAYTFGDGLSVSLVDPFYITVTRPVPAPPSLGSSAIGMALRVSDQYGQFDWGSVREVPDPASNTNNGKVLTVTNGSSGTYEWVTPASQLPSMTGNAGKVLTVNGTGTAAIWDTPSAPTIGYIYL